MQQIKIFKGMENQLQSLEEDVNQWLVENSCRVLQIFGNIAPQSASSEGKGQGLTHSDFPPSDVMMVVLYEKI